MKSPAAKLSKPARFFSALIRRSYFPTELPPAITTYFFADFCGKNYSFLKGQQPSLRKTATHYETFTAPRTKSGRRNLALVHPLAQTNISLLITEHRKKIRDIISGSKSSLYRTNEDLKNFVAFSGLDFQKRSALQAQAYSEYPITLNADISRFFYTIYTHSIPWAVLGKEKAKAWLKKSGVLGEYWLPFYEAVRRGWTADTTLIRKVKSDAVLSRMLRSKVTFLDERIFDAAQLKISRRVSVATSPKIRTTKGIARYRAQQVVGPARGFGSIALSASDLDYS
jgi:hypothetical protein